MFFNPYPALTDIDVKEGHIRLGEHEDMTALTLLFQDSMGGLEVNNSFYSLSRFFFQSIFSFLHGIRAVSM